MPPDGAFTAPLLLLLSSVSALTVPPPTNVTVSCRNLRVWVSWEFSDQQPHTSFRVEIQSSNGYFKNETTEHQYDLSGFIWKSLDHYMGFHSVRVTALQRGGESQPVRSESFTFSMNRMADKHYALEFPPVEVVAGDSGNTVSFPSPFHFYTELKQAEKQETAFFEFNVSSDQGNYTSVCRLTDVTCRYDLPHSEEQCVRVKGWLDYGNSVERVEFRETDRICPSKSSDPHVMTFALVLLFVLVVIISVLTISICKVRAWTLEIWKTQKTLKALDIEPNNEEHELLRPVEEVFSPVMVVEHSSSSSLSSEDGGLQDCGACVMEDGGSERGEPEEEAADQEAVGNYDRAHAPAAVRVDLGDGEVAYAYREG
ncbi:interferon gamma receptor 1 [Hippoglossus stenolepis]|uniref:interferon gamma receptor 1 n=1 Tax=Hippoglossus stenolepis TaxID=195615 RepID=UPI001FAEC0CE|nr:interferon gamma receptor 1 [Hippoglossus stenolepis]